MPETTNTQDNTGNVDELDLETMSLDSFVENLQKPGPFQAEYMKDPRDPKYEKLNAAYQEYVSTGKKPELSPQGTTEDQTNASQEQETTETQTGDVDLSSVDNDEVEVNVKIPKEMFGKYLVNEKGKMVRSPGEAVIAALKGNQDKDDFINVLRNKNSEATEATTLLRQKLSNALEAAEAAKNPPPQEGDGGDDDFDLSDIDNFKEGALFDPEKADEFVAKFEKMAKLVKKLTTAPPKPQVEEKTPAKNEETDTDESPEFTEIRAFQLSNPELKTEVDIKVLDGEMQNFYESIQRLSGRSVNEAWLLYNDQTEAGQKFRATCTNNNVIIPPESNKHITIMKLRIARNEELTKKAERLTERLRAKGRLKPDETLDISEVDREGMSYADYWNRLKGTLTPPPAVPGDKANLKKMIQERTENQEQNHAPTIPAGVSEQALNDPANASVEYFNYLANKRVSELTQQEAADYLSIQRYAKMPENDIPKELKDRAAGIMR